MTMLINRNIVIGERGHRTSIRLEAEVWQSLEEICFRERMLIPALMATIQAPQKAGSTFTSAVRIFVFKYFREAATEEGHAAANHGAQARHKE